MNGLICLSIGSNDKQNNSSGINVYFTSCTLILHYKNFIKCDCLLEFDVHMPEKGFFIIPGHMCCLNPNYFNDYSAWNNSLKLLRPG